MYFTFIIDIALLLSAIAFIIGLRKLGSPDTARNGNLLAALGMAIAVVGVLIYPMEGEPNNYMWIAGGLLGGTVIGQLAATKFKLTAMPQLVSVFNGFGGACAVMLGFLEFYHANEAVSDPMLSSPAIGEMLIENLVTLFEVGNDPGCSLRAAELQLALSGYGVIFMCVAVLQYCS